MLNLELCVDPDPETSEYVYTSPMLTSTELKLPTTVPDGEWDGKVEEDKEISVGGKKTATPRANYYLASENGSETCMILTTRLKKRWSRLDHKHKLLSQQQETTRRRTTTTAATTNNNINTHTHTGNKKQNHDKNVWDRS